MGDVDQNKNEETQEQTEEEKPEQPAAEETTPEKVEAKGDEAAKGEGEEPEEDGEQEEGGEAEEAAATDAQAKPKVRHEKNGYKRKIQKLEQKYNELLEHVARGQKPQETPTEKTPEQKAEEQFDAFLDRRLAAREAQQNQAKAQADFQRRMSETRAAHSDFDDVLSAAEGAPVSQAMQQVLLTSEHGPAIMYQLAKSPAELARISALPPLDAAREIGRLEAQLASGAAPQKPKSASRPPAPPTSVNGSASSTRSLDDLPLAEYKRAMRTGRR
jgi:hypothetical protein